METTTKSTLKQIFTRFKGEESELIPLLQDTQKELGYLPKEAMEEIARFLKIPASSVYGVATFYALFRLTPSGKHMLSVCRGTACHVRGGVHILRDVEKRLGIKPRETTPDMEYTLQTVACFGSCALSPVMVIDKNVYGRMTTKKVGEVLGDRKKSE